MFSIIRRNKIIKELTKLCNYFINENLVEYSFFNSLNTQRFWVMGEPLELMEMKRASTNLYSCVELERPIDSTFSPYTLYYGEDYSGFYDKSCVLINNGHEFEFTKSFGKHFYINRYNKDEKSYLLDFGYYSRIEEFEDEFKKIANCYKNDINFVNFITLLNKLFERYGKKSK